MEVLGLINLYLIFYYAYNVWCSDFKTYAFKARPWELRSVNSIDTFDALGSNTKIDFKNDEILRLLPRKCDSINGFWISNKSRYFYDAVKTTV